MTMPLSPMMVAALMATGVVSGTIDAIAGGGGLIMLPALIASGLPPQVVLGTNKLQSVMGTSVAAWRYHRAGLYTLRDRWPLAALAFGGAVCGAMLVRRIDNHLLGLVVPLLLVAMAIYTLFSPRMEDRAGVARVSARGFAPVMGIVGFYDGFFGPGAGQFYTMGLVALRGEGLTRATGTTKLVNVASNLGSLAVFLLAGQVAVELALAIAVGSMTGATIGSRLATRHGARLIRPLLVVISLALTARLVWNWFAG